MRILKTVFCICLFLFLTGCEKEAVNQPPVVNAGSDRTLDLSLSNTIDLAGSAEDADGSVVAYLWSQVSGPGTAVIARPGSAGTHVSGFVGGEYIFQLMATDNRGATGVKQVKISVTGVQALSVSLQPANNVNDVLLVTAPQGDLSNNQSQETSAVAWTVNSSPAYLRGLLKFDLSSIPASATILSAKLSLYSNPNPANGNLVDANFGSNNTLLIQRAVSAWSASTVNWQNQPAGDASSQLVIPHTSQAMLDLVDLDVTNQVRAMMQGGNYGFLLRLQQETAYTSRIFASSRHANASKHPKLVIQYSN